MRRLLLSLLAFATVVLAQDDPNAPPLAGHSHHGAAFDQGPRQAARLIEGTGHVHFPITAKTERIQALFDQGVGQLHGFWYLEAERTFRQILAEDPTCALAYFGIAMAVFYDQPRAAVFARKAYENRDAISERERLWVDAIARLYDVTKKAPEETSESWDRGRSRSEARKEPFKKRLKRFVVDLEEIVWKHPDDVEAKAFLVNQLWLNTYRSGIPYASKAGASALLDQIFAINPKHPAHHYRIHLWDKNPTAERAVASARMSGQCSPGIAHQWHMSGHIWARLKRHDDAAWQQEASARVDHAQMMRDRLMPDEIHNYAHNNEWLIRSLRLVGQVGRALDLAMNMVELPRHPRFNLPKIRGTSSYWGPRRLFEVLEMFELWDQVLALEHTMYLRPGATDLDLALRDAWVGKAAFFHGHAHRGHSRLLLVREAVAEEELRRAARLDRAEARALGETVPDDPEDASTDDAPGRLRQLQNLVAQLEALDHFFTREDHQTGLAKAKEARLPAHLRVDLALRAGLPKEALEIARAAAKGKVGEALPLATLCRALEARGKTKEAGEAFAKLREMSSGFDLDAPTFARLEGLARREGLGADWRVAARVKDDVGDRPDLGTLGPFRWAPSPVPAGWTLPDGFGKEVSLDDFSGRPVLVIFFLGFECLHCVDQLAAFGPELDAYREAGIDVVTIGTCTEEKIREAGKEAYPFPILADPDLAVFKQWRVHDDFEDLPLHGTFLVDADGLVRWQDISYEPFMEADWLLTESRRLLALPVATAKSGN